MRGYSVLYSCYILPVLNKLSIPPGEDLGLSLGPFYQGSLEDRGDGSGGPLGPVPLATLWLKVSGGEAMLTHPSKETLERALSTLKQLPQALSACLQSVSFLAPLWGKLGKGWEGGLQKLACVGRGKRLLN